MAVVQVSGHHVENWVPVHDTGADGIAVALGDGFSLERFVVEAKHTKGESLARIGDVAREVEARFAEYRATRGIVVTNAVLGSASFDRVEVWGLSRIEAELRRAAILTDEGLDPLFFAPFVTEFSYRSE